MSPPLSGKKMFTSFYCTHFLGFQKCCSRSTTCHYLPPETQHPERNRPWFPRVGGLDDGSSHKVPQTINAIIVTYSMKYENKNSTVAASPLENSSSRHNTWLTLRHLLANQIQLAKYLVLRDLSILVEKHLGSEECKSTSHYNVNRTRTKLLTLSLH